MNNQVNEWETRIKQRNNLSALGRTLETTINKGLPEDEKGFYYYLYGYILYQMALGHRAIRFLEEAVTVEPGLAKAHFLLFRIYRENKNYPKAANCLDTCIRLGYKTTFCRRAFIKISYQSKDYPAVINRLAEFDDGGAAQPLARVLRIICLQWLNLSYEASKEYLEFRKNKIPPRIQKWLRDFELTPVITQFQKTYQENQSFFQINRIVMPDFDKVRFKVCRFLDNKLVYDCHNRRFIVSLDEGGSDLSNLTIAADDSVIIYDADNVGIFEYLRQKLDELESPVYRKRIGAIPVLIIEHQEENWQLVTQLFDFNSLREWENLHFYIAINDEDLGAVLMDEYLALPNVLYGANLEALHKLLDEVHAVKEDTYRRRMESLREYYCERQGPLEKVLVITSIYNDALFYYGKLLHGYFSRQNLYCRLYCETAPFFKFSKYSDAKLLDEFRPDLVINLFALKEELAVFRELPLPFVSWLLFHKDLSGEVHHDEWQYFLLTGNPSLASELESKGYSAERIAQVCLPVATGFINQPEAEIPVGDIGIISNLDNLELVIKNMSVRIYKALVTRVTVAEETLQAIFRAVYFDIYTAYISKNFSRPELEIYQKLLKNHFERIAINFDGSSLRFIAVMVKSEIENLILKNIQAKWVLSGLSQHSLSLYGEGWDKEPTYQPFWRGPIDYLNDPNQYRQAVLGNKINLYIGNCLNNDSLMQPDLINGIVAGGFFLVNDLQIKQYGESISEPFKDLLVTYGSREEMIEKVKFYLEHDQERIKQATLLQNHVREHFSLNRVAKMFLAGTRILN